MPDQASRCGGNGYGSTLIEYRIVTPEDLERGRPIWETMSDLFLDTERLGRNRWVVERTHAWFAGFGKLRIRFERRLDIHVALLSLAAAVICSRFVDDLC
jgi:hypothetical protein